MKRIILTICVVALIFGSLIAFPVHLHWVASIWMVLAIYISSQGKSSWPWLIGLLLIITIKRPGFTSEFWIFMLLWLAVAFLDWRTRRRETTSRNVKRLLVGAVVLTLATVIYGTSRWLATNTSQQISLDARPIACLGDSLTDFGYPQELEKLISVPVADFGVNGIKTDDGIKMIPDILATQPQLVIIELGGHDYNADKKPRAATRANLVILIESFLDQGIVVVLVEIPRGFISDPYDGLERELAEEYDLQLIDDSLIRSLVFNSSIMPPGSWLDSSQQYSNDGLHPNALGNKFFAGVVAKALTKVFGDSVLKSKVAF